MNNIFDDSEALRERIRQADPANNFETLNEGVVAKAALATPRRNRALGFAGAGLVTASVMVLALAVGVQQQPLIKLGNSSGGAASEALASGDRAMMYNPFRYEYVAGAALSNERGRGSVYELALTGSPREKLAELAGRFGFSGEIVRDEWSTAENPSFSISEENRYLSIYWGGTGSWNFSSWSDSWGGCSEPYEGDVGLGGEVAPDAAVVAPDTAVVEPETDEASAEGAGSAPIDRGICEWSLTPTPELIPTRAEITRQALDLFAATGLEVSAADLRIYRDEWGASASAALRVDGEATGVEWYVGWGSNGEISYATGHSVSPIARGEFRTISPVAAVERLGDWRWYGSAASEIYEQFYGTGRERGVATSMPAEAGDQPMADDGLAVDGGESAEESEVPAQKPETDVDIMPVFPEGEEQVITVTVESAQAVMLTIYDANGAAWLVPGYLMFNSEGYFDTVIALEDGVIELPEPVDFDIMPMPADLGRTD